MNRPPAKGLMLLLGSWLASYSLVGLATEEGNNAQSGLYGDNNLIHVIELFDAVNKKKAYRESCQCVAIDTVEDYEISRYPGSKYRTLKVVATWTNPVGPGGFSASYYLVHEKSSSNKTWFAHHMPFRMLELTLPAN